MKQDKTKKIPRGDAIIGREKRQKRAQHVQEACGML